MFAILCLNCIDAHLCTPNKQGCTTSSQLDLGQTILANVNVVVLKPLHCALCLKD